MSETKTEVVPNVIDVGALADVHSPAPIVPASQAAQIQLDPARMAELGIIIPSVPPAIIRAAFAAKQQLYTAILDPETDFLYTIAYKEHGNQSREYRTTSFADAKKMSELVKAPYQARPKKSGIYKLAAALQIEAKRVKSVGLPDDPRATFSHVEYEAVHLTTQRTATGVGWCDAQERGGKDMPKHHIISTADTRAYNRAVLRLMGFGEVSAEEIGGIVGGDDGSPVIIDHGDVPQDTARKPAAECPPANDPKVVAAATAWARQVAGRQEGERLAPLSVQQKNNSWREMRARARRGDTDAATKLGRNGIAWDGIAQDSLQHEPWEVEACPVHFEQFVTASRPTPTPAPSPAATQPPAPQPITMPTHSPAATTSAASSNPEPAAASPASADEGPLFPSRLSLTDAITGAQAQKLSEVILAKTASDKEKARAILRKLAGVSRSTEVRADQYDRIIEHLAKEEG